MKKFTREEKEMLVKTYTSPPYGLKFWDNGGQYSVRLGSRADNENAAGESD